jgi:hypothetical protein
MPSSEEVGVVGKSELCELGDECVLLPYAKVVEVVVVVEVEEMEGVGDIFFFLRKCECGEKKGGGGG